MKKIIIDTDGNIEALAAIEEALKDKNICICAITTVASGLDVREATSNVLSTLIQAKKSIPVYQGISRPMVEDLGHCGKRLFTHVLTQKKPLKTRDSKNAVNAIIDLVSKENVEIITMGPLTNIALAFAKNRDVMMRVKKITMLAGMIFHGDVGPMSEYNFYMDPHSADFVLKTGVDITIVPIEVGNYSERMKYALYPKLITKKYNCYTRIDVDGEYTYGANINDVRDRGRKEFVAQSNVMYPFNCTLVADNCKEEITMEA